MSIKIQSKQEIESDYTRRGILGDRTVNGSRLFSQPIEKFKRW